MCEVPESDSQRKQNDAVRNLEGDAGRYCLRSRTLKKTKKALEIDSSDGCTMWMYLTPLDCTLKNRSFVQFIFYNTHKNPAPGAANQGDHEEGTGRVYSVGPSPGLPYCCDTGHRSLVRFRRLRNCGPLVWIMVCITIIEEQIIFNVAGAFNDININFIH